MSISQRLRAVMTPASRKLQRISAQEPRAQTLSEEQLRKEYLALRYRAQSGEPLSQLLPETYALVREAGRRALDMRHFDVQILGGIALSQRSIAEMQTGEGKTLTATLPLCLAALPGKGAHLATVNDYLARRDAELMLPLYECLGLTVGIIESDSSPEQRKAAYACDITYGTAKEFGFDFLRDRLVKRHATEIGSVSQHSEQCVQRELHFALVDEADSVLIDEASTPLVIGALPGEAQRREIEAYRFAATASGHFAEKEHYHYDHQDRTVSLTSAGQRLARSLKQPEALRDLSLASYYEFLERAIRVQRDFHKDRQYVIRDGEIVIVDEFTGRLGEGRKWRSGIHQAVEAQENLQVSVDAGQAASITVQDYFRRYAHLAGMTGTAASSTAELAKIYELGVTVVPTNRPVQRVELPQRILPNSESKWSAVVDEIAELHCAGRPVLIGTRSIDKSQQLSRLLAQAGVPHQVLNAHQVALEAEIVALAGQPGRVTVSTNMAGRGTDIKLGPGVAALGGLHVIATELHEDQRIDRQLFGRCGRQGEPGSYRQYMALDDELLIQGYGPRATRILRKLSSCSSLSESKALKTFKTAQRRVERRQFRQRKALMFHQRNRQKLHREMGQDPYLDCVG
ncbi:MAG: preprotein translocase subunit SecA [Planctomycetes bacterium]|nr:preprotein translocase subunit SecA [Planctomycetota bacterium]